MANLDEDPDPHELEMVLSGGTSRLVARVCIALVLGLSLWSSSAGSLCDYDSVGHGTASSSRLKLRIGET